MPPEIPPAFTKKLSVLNSIIDVESRQCVTESKIAELEKKTSILSTTLSELQSKIDSLILSTTVCGTSLVDADLADPRLLDVIEITNELFPGPISLEALCDPSEPNDKTVVFQVDSHESVKEIVARQFEWHRRVATTKIGSSGQVSLLVIPIE